MNRIVRWITWQRVPAARMRIDHPQRESMLALGFAAFYVLASVGTALLIQEFRAPIWGAESFTQDWWYSGLFKIGLLLIVPLVAYHAAGYRLRDLLPEWTLTVRSALSISLSFLLGFCLNLGHLQDIFAAAVKFPPGEYAARIAVGFILPFFVAGFPEEFFFRGILQTRLERVWNRTSAILLTAILFTAWHLPTRFFHAHGVEGQAGDFTSVLIGTGAPVFVVGLFLGLMWDRYRSLIPLIAAHWAIDTLPAISSFLGIDR